MNHLPEGHTRGSPLHIESHNTPRPPLNWCSEKLVGLYAMMKCAWRSLHVSFSTAKEWNSDYNELSWDRRQVNLWQSTFMCACLHRNMYFSLRCSPVFFSKQIRFSYFHLISKYSNLVENITLHFRKPNIWGYPLLFCREVTLFPLFPWEMLYLSPLSPPAPAKRKELHVTCRHMPCPAETLGDD